MAIGYLDSQKLTNIANAIRSASSSEISYTVDEMPEAIRDIAPEQPRVFKDVNFFDYDGTILYQYDLAEAKALTELPPLPPSPRSGYTADSWTETLSFIQNLDGPCDVGVNYRCTNNYSEILISIPEDNYQVCTRASTYERDESSGIFTWVEWGDGSEREKLGSITKRVVHTYAQKGDYYVKFYASYHDYFLPIPYSAETYNDARDDCAMIMPYPYAYKVCRNTIIKEAWIGTGLNASGQSVYLNKCDVLRSVLFPRNPTYSGVSYTFGLFINDSTFAHVTIPSSCDFSSPIRDTFKWGPETLVIPSSKRYGFVGNYKGVRRYINRSVSSTYSGAGDWPNCETFVCLPGELRYGMGKNLAKRIINKTQNNYSGIYSGCYNLESMDLSYLTGTAAEHISPNMFQYCSSLKSITFPTGLTTIMERAFEASGLVNITIPNGVLSLGHYCFADSAIKNIVLPNSCYLYGDYCFSHCIGLTEVHFNCPEFGNNIFQNCYNLTAIYIHGTGIPAQWGSNIFNGVSNVTIYVPNSILADYQTAFPTYANLMQGWDPSTN